MPEWISEGIRTWFFHRERNGMTEVLYLSLAFQVIIFFLFLYISPHTDSRIVQYADVGPRRPANLRAFERRYPAAQPPPAPQDAAAEMLIELEHDLERLTADIPETTLDDIPIRLQRHVVAVPGQIRRFLCKVARAVVSYRDHHQ